MKIIVISELIGNESCDEYDIDPEMIIQDFIFDMAQQHFSIYPYDKPFITRADCEDPSNMDFAFDEHKTFGEEKIKEGDKMVLNSLQRY